VRRLVATLVILAIGIPLMLWAINNALMSLSRYGVKVRPIVELDAGIVAGAVLLMVLLAVAAVTVAALVRSRRLLGA
jgi:hypothetical protein